MRIESGNMVALGYGKYFRSNSIIGLEPIEESRGPGRRTFVYVEGRPEPLIASRSEGTILRDMLESPGEVTRAMEQRQLLIDILDTVGGINPMLRTIVREQGNWNLNLLEEQIRDLLGEDVG